MKQYLFCILLCLFGSSMLLGQSRENPFTTKQEKPALDQLSDLELVREVNRLNLVTDPTAGLVKLDSVVNHYYFNNGNDVLIGDITRYTYDDRGNTIVEEILVYDEDSLTIYPEFKTTRTFNQNNQVTSFMQEVWDVASQNYMLFVSSNYFYQNDNLLDSTVTSVFNFFTMTVDPSSSAKYNYNGDNQLILISQYFRQNNDWVLSSNTTFTYNGDLLTESITSFYDSNTSMFTPNDRTQYTYNGQRVASQTNSRWDPYGQNWTFTDQTIYTYDNNGNTLSETDNIYDEMLMSWVPDEKIEYTYTNDDKVLTSLSSEWDSNAGEWIPLERENFTYANGNVVTYLQDTYDSDNSVWLSDFRTRVIVDNSINAVDVIAGGDFTSELFSFFTNAPDTLFNAVYDENEMNYVEEDFSVYYYSPFAGTVKTTELVSTKDKLKLIPNPATSEVQFQFEGQSPYDLHIFDLMGRLVHSQRISNNQTLSIERWPSGVYIVNVQGNNNQILKTKLVKR